MTQLVGLKMSRLYIAAVVLLAASQAKTDNSTALGDGDMCVMQPWETGPWGSLLEEWATSASSVHRQGRIMALPVAKGYYVSDRIDLIPPPPPPPYYRPTPPSIPHGQHYPPAPQHGMHYPSAHNQGQYEEWQATPPPPPGASKIVNRPPNPYKDKFKPGYALPSPNQPIPVHGAPPPAQPPRGPPPTAATPTGPAADRVDEPTRPPPPQKQVSETDLYLLGAIEKLVYRVDLMEKRLRKMEENMHYLVAGGEAKPEACAANFTRVGGGCYHFSSDALNWKNANFACRKLRAHLLELDAGAERQALLATPRLQGADWWTGGLNPGLLWIWSHSARAVAANSSDTGGASQTGAIRGDGRCLALAPAGGGGGGDGGGKHEYRGQDCSLRHRFVCEKEEDKNKLSNEIERVAKKLRDGKQRKSKVLWADDEP